MLQSLTIGDLKLKLELITGGSSGNMEITVYDKDDKVFLVSLLKLTAFLRIQNRDQAAGLLYRQVKAVQMPLRFVE